MAEIKTPANQTIYRSKYIHAEIRFDPGLGARLDSTFGIGSDFQKFWDNMVMTGMEPYVPLLTGVLVSSAPLNTVLGNGEIIYRTPYARRQYFEGRMPGESQTGALRGRLWAERAKNDLMPTWTANAQAWLNGQR